MNDVRFGAAPPRISPYILQRETSSACLVDERLRITFVNDAWRTFARANGADPGWPNIAVGADLIEVTPDVLRPFYARLFERVREGRQLVTHDYECSSADVERRFRMHVYPDGEGGYAVVHALARERAHARPNEAHIEAYYRDRRGLIVQCSSCRCVRRADESAWEWAPELVRAPARGVSHGLCRVCSKHHYGDDSVD